MKIAEIRCQTFTEDAMVCANERGTKREQMDEAIREKCDCCGKNRGIGYVWFTEDGKTKCLFCGDNL